jgi:predicted amidohydrolase
MSVFTSTTTYRVAAIQYETIPGEKAQNIAALLALVEDAARNDARLIVLPELATTGSCWQAREEIAPHVEPVPGPTTAQFQSLATSYQCYIALSLPEVDPLTQLYYDTVVLLGPEGLIGKYRKLHASISEPRWASEGDLGVPVWETPLGCLALLADADVLYFETARSAALRGADVLLLPVSWRDEICPRLWWMARAFENNLAVIVANRVGRERTMGFSGGSCVLNPDGSLQHHGENTGAGIVYGEINLPACREKQWRQDGRTVGYPLGDRRPGEYLSLAQNSYLWEPLRYHALYNLAELPPGQLSCVGFLQLSLQTFVGCSSSEIVALLQGLVTAEMRVNAPASPDILVLPELLLPGPFTGPVETAEQQSQYVAHFQRGALQIPSPETDALVALAQELQISLVVGVAEREADRYYSTVLLIDPEGIYGLYRKLHLSALDRLWAMPGDRGLPTFDTPSGRIGLATGYDVLFPETLRVLAGKGVDLVCAPALLGFPGPLGRVSVSRKFSEDDFDTDPYHGVLWRVRAAEHNVYLALVNWSGAAGSTRANGLSGVYPPTCTVFPWPEVTADEDEPGLMMMTIDTREQRTGRRTSHILSHYPGDMAGSLTGELAYDVFDSIPGNVVRSKPWLRKRQPLWYRDLVRVQ